MNRPTNAIHIVVWFCIYDWFNYSCPTLLQSGVLTHVSLSLNSPLLCQNQVETVSVYKKPALHNQWRVLRPSHWPSHWGSDLQRSCLLINTVVMGYKCLWPLSSHQWCLTPPTLVTSPSRPSTPHKVPLQIPPPPPPEPHTHKIPQQIPPPPPVKSKSNTQFEDPIMQVLPQDNDADELFSSSLAPTVRQLADENQKSEAKREVMNLIHRENIKNTFLFSLRFCCCCLDRWLFWFLVAVHKSCM